MPRITAARAYANNEIAFIAWDVDGKIPGCLGFEVTRVYLNADGSAAHRPDGTEDRVICASWVPFTGQHNPYWLPQTTGVWPIQKLTWGDFTVRKRRDQLKRRPDEVRVAYDVRPVGKWKKGLERAPDPTPRRVRVAKRDRSGHPIRDANGHPVIIEADAYEGRPQPLAYLDAAARTNDVLITSRRGIFRSTFTNGILAAQWLSNVLFEDGKLEPHELIDMISKEGEPHRQYLAGDVLPLLHELLSRPGEFFLALYELADQELINLLLANPSRVHVILANSALEHGKWDGRNRLARRALVDAHVDIQHRMFNNSGHIGHNKFVVHVPPNDAPRSVFTGSTNWTSTGVAGQTNNALLIENDAVAGVFLTYWHRLHDDALTVPRPFSKPEKDSVQSATFRALNVTSDSIPVPGGGVVETWFSPNMAARTKGTKVPPDLADVYDRMRLARQAILFLAFYPGQSGKDCIIGEAIDIGRLSKKLIVVGAVSSAQAMPNYVPKQGDQDGGAAQSPHVFQADNVSIVRASRIEDRGLLGDFGLEQLTANDGIGAIIHDKIVVIDPFLDTCVVILGSHNLGFKASYANDENLVIVTGDRALAEAYAVHVLDVYDHYRFRAIVAERKAKGQPQSSGFLSTTPSWMNPYVSGQKGRLMRYFAHQSVD